MLRSRLWICAATAVIAVAAVLSGFACADTAGRPPVLDPRAVKDFWVLTAGPEGYHPVGSLSAVLDAYNHARGTGFDTETTPDFEAFLKLEDGTQVCLMFSSLFPRGGVLVAVSRGSAGAGETGSTEFAAQQSYEVVAPGLLDAVLTLAGDHIDRSSLGSLVH